MEKFLWSARPLLSDAEYNETERVVAEFAAGEGLRLHNELQERDKSAPHTSYISDMWYDYYLSSRDSIAIGSNPFLAFEPDPACGQDQCARATAFTSAIARFYLQVRDRRLAPDVWNVFPLDMSQCVGLLA